MYEVDTKRINIANMPREQTFQTLFIPQENGKIKVLSYKYKIKEFCIDFVIVEDKNGNILKVPYTTQIEVPLTKEEYEKKIY